MKVIVLMAGSRAGLEFFQSLLDSHEEVLQLPGILYIDANLIKILSIKSKESLAKKNLLINTQIFLTQENQILRDIICWGQIKKNFIK